MIEGVPGGIRMTSEPSTALGLHREICTGERSAQTLLEETFATIKKVDSDIQAFNFLTPDEAYQIAALVDKQVQAGAPLPLLAGVPLALKDNIHMQGVRTTCSSRILENYVAPFDATVTRQLKTAMIPIVGKTNLDEFAMGSSTENSAFHVTKNPWDLSRVPGGSSGGSAAAVSSAQVTLALGSDTGGSVRQPASLCGILGLKPTYGLVSRYGLVAYASSLDQISPFTANVEDMAALLQVLVRTDPQDSTSIPNLGQQDYLSMLKDRPQKLRVGFVRELLEEGLQPEVAQSMQDTMKLLRELGFSVETVSMPHFKYAVASYYIIATAEASSNLARFDGVRYGLRVHDEKDILRMYMATRAKGFGREVKRRIMLGTFSLSAGYYDAYYGQAQKIRQLIRHDFETAFQQVDVLASPTSPTTAFQIGEKTADPVQMYLSDVATIPINLAGIPALSMPCGFDQQHLPIGLQLMGPHLSEALLLRTAFCLESETGLKNLHPLPQTCSSTAC